MQTTTTTTRPEREQQPREQGPENEIRVSFKTDVLRAVERAAAAFNTFEVVKFSAINSGISKLILIVEITKIKLEGLHQVNHLETLVKERIDESNEKRQGYLTAFKIELSKTKPSTIPTGYMYQAPYTTEHVEAVRSVKTEDREPEEGRRGGFGRGRGRGFGRGRGRGGRGRGGRGRGRGGLEGEARTGLEGENRGEVRTENRGEVRTENRGEFRGSERGFRGGRGGFRGGFRGSENRGEFRGSERGSRGGRGGPRGFGRGGLNNQTERPQTTPNTTAPVTTAPRTTIPGLSSGPRTNPPMKK